MLRSLNHLYLVTNGILITSHELDFSKTLILSFQIAITLPFCPIIFHDVLVCSVAIDDKSRRLMASKIHEPQEDETCDVFSFLTFGDTKHVTIGNISKQLICVKI